MKTVKHRVKANPQFYMNNTGGASFIDEIESPKKSPQVK